MNLACNPPSQLIVQCLDLVQSERPGNQNQVKKGGTAKKLEKGWELSPSMDDPSSAITGYYWSKWQGMTAAPGHADGTNEWKFWASELSSD